MANPVVGSQVVSIGELLLSGVFGPANVQRDYCWKTRQQSALLQDLIAAFDEFGFDPEAAFAEEAHADNEGEEAEEPAFPLAQANPDIDRTEPYSFLGALVLRPNGTGFEIYDGLQRLSTLIVLFAVLRDLVGAKARDTIVPLLETDGGQYRLELTMKYDTLRADVLTAGRTAKRYRDLPGITEPGACLRECVTGMRGVLKQWTEPRLLAFAAFVRDHVLVSVISMTDRRMAGRAFIDINVPTVPLRPEQVLKSQLVDLAETAPSGIEDPLGRILFVWKTLRDDLGKDFDGFLRSVDFLERRAKQSPDYAIQLMEHIRRSYGGAEGFKWATDRLLQYRSAFRWVHEGQDDEVATGARASLRRLQILKWDQWRAFAMLIKIKSRPQDLDKRIDVLDRMCFALTLTYEDGRKCAELLGRRLERFARGPFGRNGGFTFKDSQHKRMLRTLGSPLSDNRRGSVMRWLEAASHGDRVPRYLIDDRSSVEHVYPKNPGNNWLVFEKGMDIENAATLLDMTGNLCVLPQDELGNASFEEKRKSYQRLRNCKFANEIASVRQWTPDQIRARTERLRDWTMKLLDLDIVPDEEKQVRRK